MPAATILVPGMNPGVNKNSRGEVVNWENLKRELIPAQDLIVGFKMLDGDNMVITEQMIGGYVDLALTRCKNRPAACAIAIASCSS